MLPSSQLRDVTIKDYLVIIKRRLWIILISLAIVSLWSTLKTFKKTPLYLANAKIVIERTTPYIAPIQEVYTAPSWIDREYIQTQMNILTSRTLAKKAVENLISAGDTTFIGMKEPESAFLGGVNVNIMPGTQLINVGYTSPDPIKAAKFANILTNAFIEQDIGKRIEASKYATGWLQTQLTEMMKRLQATEVALDNYIQKNEIVALPDIEKKAEGGLEALKQGKISIENELAELAKRYKPKHPKMINLNTRLQSLNSSIDVETKKLLVLNAKTIQYNVLKREVDSNKSLYESLLRRVKETEVAKELEATNIRIIDLANVPKAPFTPNHRRDIMMGVFLGLFLGAGLAFAIEYFDSTVKTAEDIEMYVRLPFLGYVPSAKAEARAQKDIDMLSFKKPHSRFAEAYRTIRSSVIFSAPEDKPLKTILITSSSPEEGKSTVAINLSTIFALANEKILLVEADMRRPRLSGALDLDNQVGLSNLLIGTAPLDAAIRQTNIPNLSVILSGPKPPNPTELISSTKTKSILEELKARFTRIIIDSPPLLSVADSLILANQTDGVIDVVRAGFQNIELILRGRQRLIEAKARIIGVILNNVNVKREDSYYYYHYYYTTEDKK